MPPSSAARSQAQASEQSGPGTEQATYIYGILPGDVELSSRIDGVGEPPGPVSLVRSGGLAALVSHVNPQNPLGSPQDLSAHKEILDATATAAPVLPMRFGAVLASDEAVSQELLDPYRGQFTATLAELEGRVQYVIKGRYVERAILEEILSENPRAGWLREQIRGKDPYATRELRIELGEIINGMVEEKRRSDTQAVGDAMEGHCVASAVRQPTHEQDAVNVAFLVDASQDEELGRATGNLAREWEGRVELSLLGPMAAFDFAAAIAPG